MQTKSAVQSDENIQRYTSLKERKEKGNRWKAENVLIKMCFITLMKYKENLVRRMLTFRCFCICSSPFLLRSFLKKLRKLLWQNDCSTGVAIYNIKFLIDN